MVCEKCRKKTATYHITQLTHGALEKVVRKNLCAACAKAAGFAEPAFPDVRPAVSKFGRFSPRSSAMLDAVALYLRQIKQLPTLSPEQEAAVLRRLRAKGDKADARAAAAELAAANLRLVIAIAKRYVTSGGTFLGLIHEGNLGLMSAVKRFVPARDGEFREFARERIRVAIVRALGKPQ